MTNGFRYPYPTHYLNIEDAGRIAYIDEGAGDTTILFVHGLANYALGWRKNIEQLSKNFRCLALDLPGNGLSDKGDRPYSMHYFAGVVIKFIEALQLKNLTLAGHSMGGQIVMTALLRQPDLAERLVLIAPAGFEVFTPWEATMYQASISVFDYFSSEENSLTKSIRSSFHHYTHQADDMIRDLLKLMSGYPVADYRKMIHACIHGMLHEPVYNSLHLIRQPTLVIFGERDALIPARALHPVTTRKIAEEGTARLPSGNLRLLPACGHFAQWEKADQVNQFITSFVQEPRHFSQG